MRTKKVKKMSVRSHPAKMQITSSAKRRKTRLVLSCTEEEKRYIRDLAAKEDKSVTDYLLEKPRQSMPSQQCEFPGCSGVHIPNKKTEKVLRDTDAGRNLESHASLKDFWKAMGINPNAQN